MDAPIQASDIVETENTGDFGEGTLSAEQDLLKSLEDAEAKSAEEADKAVETEGEAKVEAPVETKPEATPTEPVPFFDMNGKVSVKAGEKLTPEHIKELERGWLRESDYTRKTQELSGIRKEASEILQARDQIAQNPQALRQYFTDEHLLSAFTKQEMLNNGLAAAGVPVEIWNQFLDYMKESGTMPEAPKADPYVKQFGAINQQLTQFGKTLQQLQAEKQQAVIMQQEAEQKQAYEREMNRIGAEVDQALQKYPSIEKEDLLVKMASGKFDQFSVEQIAKKLNDIHEVRFSEYVKKKTEQKQTSVKPANGTSVPVLAKKPKNWEEVDALMDKMFPTGGFGR